MLHSFKGLRDYDVHGTEGRVGSVADLFFQDEDWAVRHVVLDTGNWLPGRKVLLPPPAFAEPVLRQRALPVGLTNDEVKEGPGIDADLPVSKQLLSALKVVWPTYTPNLAAAAGAGVALSGAAQARAMAETAVAEADPHLRSADEVVGYRVTTPDGKVGHVGDFIVELDGWTIRYLIVDTNRWLPGHTVLIDPTWAAGFDWADREVALNMTEGEVEKAPRYDPRLPINREWEERLYDYHGRVHPW